MTRWRLLALLAAASVTACGLVLGLEDLPLRPSSGDGGATDATTDTTCVPSARTGCACTTADFCEDFDQPGADIFLKWEAGLPSQPFKRGSSTLTVVDGGISPPSAALSDVGGSANNSAYAAIFEQLNAGRSINGVRLRFTVVKLAELNVLPGGGPVAAGSAYVGAVIKVINPLAQQFGGAAVLFGMDGHAYLAVSPNILNSKNTDSAVKIYEAAVTLAKDNAVPMEIVVAKQSKAIELGYAMCADVDAGPGPDGGEPGVAAAMFFADPYKGCLPLTGDFGDVDWVKNAVIGLGSGVFNGGTVKVLYDNVTAEFL